MSRKVFIAKDKMTAALARVAEKIKVWVPVESGNGRGGVHFKPYLAGMSLVLGRRSTMPPKGVLLPQVEPLLHFAYRKSPEDPSRVQVTVSEPEPTGPALVFGARPCDVRGFLVFDRSFTMGSFVDAYYRRRRESTLFATLLCREADSACFCSSVGSGPADMEGSDIRLTPLGEGYLAEALTGRAQMVVDLLGDDATEVQIIEAEKLQGEMAQQRVGDLDPEGSMSAFLDRFEDKMFWKDVAGRCLSCGVCTYLCPTCYCFTITDEMKGLQGERLRSWDSCMFFNYTAEASGHNPRPSRFKRYRNRVGHKFSYFPEKYDGMIGCCGCGRCIRSCPVSMDIRRVVKQLKEKADACA